METWSAFSVRVPQKHLGFVILSEGGLPRVFSGAGNPSRRTLGVFLGRKEEQIPRKMRSGFRLRASHFGLALLGLAHARKTAQVKPRRADGTPTPSGETRA